MREDQELACDALALSYLKPEDKNNYGYTVIKLLESYSLSTTILGKTSFAGHKSTNKRRITMIKQFQHNREALWKICIGVLAVTIIAMIALTNASSGEESTNLNSDLDDHVYTHEIDEESYSWDVRHEYTKDGEVLFTIFPEPGVTADYYFGYMISFTEDYEAYSGKQLAIFAYHQETGDRINVQSPRRITEQSPGYPSLNRYTTSFLLPYGGLWRLEFVLDNDYYGDVVLFVYDRAS